MVTLLSSEIALAPAYAISAMIIKKIKKEIAPPENRMMYSGRSCKNFLITFLMKRISLIIFIIRPVYQKYFQLSLFILPYTKTAAHAAVFVS